MDIKTVSEHEINKILSIQQVFDRLYKATMAHQDYQNGQKAPRYLLNSDTGCKTCLWLGMECVLGSQYKKGECGCDNWEHYENKYYPD